MIETHWTNKGFPVKTVWLPLKTYKDIAPITQVYGLCFSKEGKVMIIRNPLEDGGYTPWYLPGGTPEENETPEETLKRELDEEADISVENLILLGAFEVFFPNNPNTGKGNHFYQLRYYAEIAEIREQTLDPSDNKMVERKLIPAEEFTKYIYWGPVGDELTRTALFTFKKEHRSI